MRIIVFDVAAKKDGALTVLNEWYDRASKQTNIQWYFIVSIPNFEKSYPHIKVFRYPWVAKSWFHRLFFDFFRAKRIINEYKIDEIISLQNICIPFINKKQTVFIHQVLPYTEYKFDFFENQLMWIYQNLIGKLINFSVKKADEIIVQTEWLRKKIIQVNKIPFTKIKVIPPEMNLNISKYYRLPTKDRIQLFYPASSYDYKNHRIIVEAIHKLKLMGKQNYHVYFTLKGDETKELIRLKETIDSQQLNIYFVGQLSKELVFEYYSNSILLFPSFIESFGLPLLEAKLHKTPILASDLMFAHDILDDYDLVNFFNPFDSSSLIECLENLVKRI